MTWSCLGLACRGWPSCVGTAKVCVCVPPPKNLPPFPNTHTALAGCVQQRGTGKGHQPLPVDEPPDDCPLGPSSPSQRAAMRPLHRRRNEAGPSSCRTGPRDTEPHGFRVLPLSRTAALILPLNQETGPESLSLNSITGTAAGRLRFPIHPEASQLRRCSVAQPPQRRRHLSDVLNGVGFAAAVVRARGF